MNKLPFLSEDVLKLLIDEIAFLRHMSIASGIEETDRLSSAFRSLAEKAEMLLFEIHNEIKGRTSLYVAIAGNFSAGKSSFINALLGEELCPVNAEPTTSSCTIFRYSDVETIIRGDDGNQISRDDYSQMVKSGNMDCEHPRPYEFQYFYPFDALRNIALIDTPGFENPENKFDTRITTEAIGKADIVLFLLDANRGGLSGSTLKTINDIRKHAGHLSWYLIINKADEITETGMQNIVRVIKTNQQGVFDQIFEFSSKNAIETLGNPLEVAIDRFVSEIKDKIGDNIDFLHSISGCGTDSDFVLKIDRSSCSLSDKHGPKSYWTKRNQMLSFFESLRTNKENIIKKKLQHEVINYNKRKNQLLNNTKKELTKCLSVSKNDSDSDIDTLYSEMKDRIISNEVNEKLARGARSWVKWGFGADKIPKSQKTFWSTPYGRILFFSVLLHTKIADSEIYDNVDDNIQKTLTNFERDIGLNGLTKEYTLKKESLRKESIDIYIYWLKKTLAECLGGDKKADFDSDKYSKMSKINQSENSYRCYCFYDNETAAESLDDYLSGPLSQPFGYWAIQMSQPYEDFFDEQLKQTFMHGLGKQHGHFDSDKKHVMDTLNKLNEFLQSPIRIGGQI